MRSVHIVGGFLISSAQSNSLTSEETKRKLAERVGFEPTVVFSYARFPGVCLKPLSHLSAQRKSGILARNCRAAFDNLILFRHCFRERQSRSVPTNLAQNGGAQFGALCSVWQVLCADSGQKQAAPALPHEHLVRGQAALNDSEKSERQAAKYAVIRVQHLPVYWERLPLRTRIVFAQSFGRFFETRAKVLHQSGLMSTPCPGASQTYSPSYGVSVPV
jgi:hypothetical protein